MKLLTQLIAQNEDWLTARILFYAKRQGYTAYTSTLLQAWRLSIAGLSQSIMEATAHYEDVPEISPEEDLTHDPVARFGMQEAQRHRERGISLAMFLGLTKYYRQAYLDLLRERDWPSQRIQRDELYLNRIFDRIEIAFCTGWAGGGAERAVQELQEKNRLMTNEKNWYLTILESIPNPVIILDDSDQIENMNLAAAQLIDDKAVAGGRYYQAAQAKDPSHATSGDAAGGGSRAAGFIGRPLGEFLPWLDEELEIFHRQKRDSIFFEKQLELFGKERSLLIRINKNLDVSEKFKGVVIVLEDVTSLYDALADLEKKNREIRVLFSSMSEGFCLHEIIYDDDGQAVDYRVLDINPKYEEVVGVSRGEAIGAKASKLYGTGSAPYLDIYAQVAASGRTVHFETYFAPLDKHFMIAAFSPERGKFATIFSDITEKKKAEEELVRSEQQYRLLAENTSDVIWTVDKDLNITYVSPSVKKNLGFMPGELIGQNALSFFTPKSSQSVRKLRAELKAWLEHGERHIPPITMEEEQVRKDGSMVWAEGVLNLVFDGDGNFHHIQVVSRDIEERRKLEAQLRQSQKMESLGTMAGGIAHEFNNILSVIMGYTELAQMDVDESGEVAANLKAVLNAAERARGLVSQILAFSRHDAGKLNPLGLRKELLRIIEKIKRTFPPAIEVSVLVAPDLRDIKGNAGQIEQIMFALASNAKDAMPQGGRLKLEAVNVVLDQPFRQEHPELRAGPQVRLRVSDNGEGMETKVLEQIYDPFFTTKEVGKGTGLGLSTVHGLVRLHEGSIICQSEPGRGTTFDLYFPAI